MVADFLKAAAEQYHFVPERPKNEAEFKQAYAKVAAAAGLTKDQAVRIYAFETGGNGTYDVQAGLTSRSARTRAPISPAMGYNQLAQHQHGEPAGRARRQVRRRRCRQSAEALAGRRAQGDGAQDRGAADR